MNNIETQQKVIMRPHTVEDTNYVAAPLQKQEWHFSTPPAGRPLQLLTIAGICVVGNWCGKVGQYFTAWAPLLVEDEPTFNHLH